MRITVFTSNQPRHVSLIESLSTIADEVFTIQECNTVFPGQVDDFFRKSPVMQDYFSRVIGAEREVFGAPRFPARSNVRQLPIKMGDLSRLDVESLAPAMQADIFIVFGASYIKGTLCDALVERRAINIHMGVSPQYRGSSTNFWAMYDRRPEFVGATIHLLSKGLDSGPILFHALPKAAKVDPFVYGMRAVRAAHESLVEKIKSAQLGDLAPVDQDRTRELRYTRNADFTDAIAAEYLSRLQAPSEMQFGRDLSTFVRPVVI
ncbi:MAG: methionyl-tRNA formyltransferase [Anaerolineae bacterium]|nr:methionyl-tRNA formyltransferase [Phycisphaerae bacterium]